MSVGIRCTLLLFAAFVAILLPFFQDILALLGASTATLTVFIFPVVFYEALFPERRTLRKRCFHGIIVMGGLYLLLTGSYNSIRNMAANAKSYHVF